GRAAACCRGAVRRSRVAEMTAAKHVSAAARLTHAGLLYTELTKPMEPKEPIAVLVVGAGPTGLVTALTLAINGVPARVIDSHPSAVTSSRALGCQPRSMEILAALGVAEPILAVSEPLHGSSIMRGTEELVDVRWIPPQAPFPYTYVF